jgi:hypothetical protein
LERALSDVEVLVAAGAAGVQLLTGAERQAAQSLRVAIDLNAVPPFGLQGIEPTDKARDREGMLAYGALGIGSTKMKIHKAAVQKLFTDQNLLLDAEEIYVLGKELT